MTDPVQDGGPSGGGSAGEGGGALLSGLRVIELSSFVAAPLGGMTLAQLGADVIRIDPVGGSPDVGRWPLAPSGVSLYWTGLNRGKRSVVLDLDSAGGRELVLRLVAESGPQGGIVITNAIGRSWCGPAALSALRPDLVYVQLEGHHGGRPAVDYTVNAAVGLPWVTGPGDHTAPINHVLPAWDVACGLQVAIGVLAAERRRRLTGRGEVVHLALYDVALAMTANLGFLSEVQVNGTERERLGNYVYGTFARDFATSDGHHLMIVALTRRHWAELVEMTDTTGAVGRLADLLGADFTDEGERFRHREAIAAVLGPWFATRSCSLVEQSLARTNILWSTYRSFREVVREQTAADSGDSVLGRIEQSRVGTILAARSPLRTTVSEWSPASPAPALGGDTEAVLRQVLGLDEHALSGLRQDGVLGG